ncbi:MAG: hypothetical protein CMH54_07720 [Myxococcales bacterium]|nr:hypothetical protein [Myxococcales bacterium]
MLTGIIKWWIPFVLISHTLACGSGADEAQPDTSTQLPDTSNTVDLGTPEQDIPDNSDCSTIDVLLAKDLPSGDNPKLPVYEKLCDVVVTQVYHSGFFIQESADGRATEVYVGYPTSTGEGGWLNTGYPQPQRGQILDMVVTELTSYKGHEEITKIEPPVQKGTTDVSSFILDLSDGIVPSEELESRLVSVSNATVSKTDVKGGVRMDYGTAQGVLLFVENMPPVCLGATIQITEAVIIEHEGEHELKLFTGQEANISIDISTCVEPEELDDSNWDFEDWSTSNPPPGFINETEDFNATQSTSFAHGDTGSSCLLTWTSKENQDFVAGYYKPAGEGGDYTISMWVHDEDPNGRVRMGIIFYDPAKEKIETKYASKYSKDEPGWQYLTYTRTAPEGTAYVRTFVRMYDAADFTNAGYASVHIDDIGLEYTP